MRIPFGLSKHEASTAHRQSGEKKGVLLAMALGMTGPNRDFRMPPLNRMMHCHPSKQQLRDEIHRRCIREPFASPIREGFGRGDYIEWLSKHPVAVPADTQYIHQKMNAWLRSLVTPVKRDEDRLLEYHKLLNDAEKDYNEALRNLSDLEVRCAMMPQRQRDPMATVLAKHQANVSNKEKNVLKLQNRIKIIEEEMETSVVGTADSFSESMSSPAFSDALAFSARESETIAVGNMDSRSIPSIATEPPSRPTVSPSIETLVRAHNYVQANTPVGQPEKEEQSVLHAEPQTPLKGHVVTEHEMNSVVMSASEAEAVGKQWAQNTLRTGGSFLDCLAAAAAASARTEAGTAVEQPKLDSPPAKTFEGKPPRKRPAIVLTQAEQESLVRFQQQRQTIPAEQDDWRPSPPTAIINGTTMENNKQQEKEQEDASDSIFENMYGMMEDLGAAEDPPEIFGSVKAIALFFMRSAGNPSTLAHQIFLHMDGMSRVVTAMDQFPLDGPIQACTCAVLWSVSRYDAELTRPHLPLILRTLQQHRTNVTVHLYGCAALDVMVETKEGRAALARRAGIVRSLVDVLQEMIGNTEIRLLCIRILGKLHHAIGRNKETSIKAVPIVLDAIRLAHDAQQKQEEHETKVATTFGVNIYVAPLMDGLQLLCNLAYCSKRCRRLIRNNNVESICVSLLQQIESQQQGQELDMQLRATQDLALRLVEWTRGPCRSIRDPNPKS